MSIVKIVVEEKPLFYLGIPGAAFLFAGMLFGSRMLQIYTSKGYIQTNIALASIAFVLIGLFVTFAAITLYAISRIARKQKE